MDLDIKGVVEVLDSFKVKSKKPRLTSRLVRYIRSIEENRAIGLLTKPQNRNLDNSKYHLVRSIDNISKIGFLDFLFSLELLGPFLPVI